jgi:hypothetical protein
VIAGDLTVRATPAPVPERARRAPVRPLLAVLPWCLPAGVTVAGLLWTGVAAADVARYAGYLVAYVVVPGTLVHRLLRGSRGNVPEDVGLGAATGLLLQLVVWAGAAATGQQQLLRWWVVPVVAAFLLVPAWRRHWRVTDPRPLPAGWSWAVAGGLVILVGTQLAEWVVSPLPPVAAIYYPDLMYHLALVHEMTRSMPFEVPQLAGDTLRYHYLSDADMAVAGLISGVDPAVVLMRLWSVPVGVTAVLVFAVLARDVTGAWWAGPLAGTAAIATFPLLLGPQSAGAGGPALFFHSPSQSFALPLMALFAAIGIDAIRGRLSTGGWLLVPVLVVACAGAKSSALPPLAAGLLAAGAVIGVRYRRVPWAVLGLVVAAAAGTLVGVRLFAGGGASILSVHPLSLLRAMPPYTTTVGANDGVDDGGTFLPPGVASAGSRAAVPFLAGLILWWLIVQSPRLLGLLGVGSRRMAGDPVAWFLGGTVVAGLGAAWTFFHPSASQGYFFLCAAPFGVVLTVRLLVDRARRSATVVLGLVAGAVWILLVPPVPVPAESTVRAWSAVLLEPVLWAAAGAVAALAGAVALVVVRRGPAPVRRLSRAALAASVAAVLGAGLGSAVAGPARAVAHADDAPPFGTDPVRTITEAEMSAALWLGEHSARDDVIATNVHCVPIGRTPPCDARAFWVAGLSGRRTVIESWGYSDASAAANGAGGLRYTSQPPPYPSLFARNAHVFAAADPAALAELRQRFGVRWLFADSRAGPVSPGLGAVASLRHTSGPVTVYEVR